MRSIVTSREDISPANPVPNALATASFAAKRPAKNSARSCSPHSISRSASSECGNEEILFREGQNLANPIDILNVDAVTDDHIRLLDPDFGFDDRNSFMFLPSPEGSSTWHIWCTRTLRETDRQGGDHFPYARPSKACAYELGVGKEPISPRSRQPKPAYRPARKIIIPPGQFGLLTTCEVVTVPEDTIAFISIRAGIKFRGLVNVSGFHVDPGYKGHLKFAVYNAGSQPVVLDQKQRVFMIWFSELDDVDTEPYKNKPRGRNIIDSDDVARSRVK